MEDMTYLAIVEQNIGDQKMFNNILLALLESVNSILDDPYDVNSRIIDSELLESVYECDSLTQYLRYVGYEWISNHFVYPIEKTLSKLRLAQTALERKIYFCIGHVNINRNFRNKKNKLPVAEKPEFKLANILTTNNQFLQRIQLLFNNMIQYENEDLQDYARSMIPIVSLQMRAINRMREHQKKIKSGETKIPDLPFDTALLIELMGWFKNQFFKWVDKPNCDECGGATVFVRKGLVSTHNETCRVEIYNCPICTTEAKFVRYNDPETLLRTRRGRCGEWANVFTLLCRSLNYDTRYVFDTTDHVWCEVFDFDSNTWVHVDPCEGKLNTPLMYSHGWKKSISYVIATSRDDLQDVTWRYTTDHSEVRSRRDLCSEQELISSIMALRQHRQSQVSEARRKYLIKRGLQELVQLMVERTPGDYETQGRISGSVNWRQDRGEIGVNSGYIFQFASPGIYAIQYFSGPDKYRISHDGKMTDTVESWANGVFNSKNVFRKEETDWKKVYIAREENESIGTVSWKLMVADSDVRFYSLSVKLISALYENGRIDWTVQFDEEKPISVNFGESSMEFVQQYKEVVITAELSGGIGDVAWQHAQLFRQNTDDDACAFEIRADVKKSTKERKAALIILPPLILGYDDIEPSTSTPAPERARVESPGLNNLEKNLQDDAAYIYPQLLEKRRLKMVK